MLGRREPQGDDFRPNHAFRYRVGEETFYGLLARHARDSASEILRKGEADDPYGSSPASGLLFPEAVCGALGRHREPHPQAILTGWPAAAVAARRVPNGRREDA